MLNLAIGQGELLVTPLQLALMAAEVADRRHAAAPARGPARCRGAATPRRRARAQAGVDRRRPRYWAGGAARPRAGGRRRAPAPPRGCPGIARRRQDRHRAEPARRGPRAVRLLRAGRRTRDRARLRGREQRARRQRRGAARRRTCCARLLRCPTRCAATVAAARGRRPPTPRRWSVATRAAGCRSARPADGARGARRWSPSGCSPSTAPPRCRAPTRGCGSRQLVWAGDRARRRVGRRPRIHYRVYDSLA